MNVKPNLSCICCRRKPAETPEYISAALVEDVTPDEFVWAEEGTLNHTTGYYLCTECYIEFDQPRGRLLDEMAPEKWPDHVCTGVKPVHVTSVDIVARDGLFRAFCLTCSYTGEPRATIAEASVDKDEHMREMSN